NDWPALIVLLVVCWALASRFVDLGARSNALIFAMVIGALGKFASFPLGEDRLYFPFVIGMTLMLAIVWPRVDEAMRSALCARSH
ncbi:MAG: hypothetical protein WBF87_08430, partial [Mesorhizobium sp.]